MELIRINARGTIIDIPKDIAFKSEYIKTNYAFESEYIKANYDEHLYLNFSADVVHKLIDYLTYNDIKYIDELQTISDFLLIEIPQNASNRYELSEIQKKIIITKYNLMIRSDKYKYCYDMFENFFKGEIIKYDVDGGGSFEAGMGRRKKEELFYKKGCLDYDNIYIYREHYISSSYCGDRKMLCSIQYILDVDCALRKKIIDFYKYVDEFVKC